MNDQQRLSGYIDVAREAIDDFVALLETIPDEAWSIQTDLPGWDVKAVASHVAHLESVLAGIPEADVEVGEAEHMTAVTAAYTERGVVARRDHAPSDIIAEIRAASTIRFVALEADPPSDGNVTPETGIPVSWTWNTLLRNRPLDVWMHEQDIRRAVGFPGGMDSAAATHSADYFAEGLGFVVAKRAAAPTGTTVVLEVEGSAPFAVTVTEQRRGEALAVAPELPTVRLALGRESFIVLAGGRRPPEAGTIVVEGDEELAGRILANLTTTS